MFKQSRYPTAIPSAFFQTLLTGLATTLAIAHPQPAMANAPSDNHTTHPTHFVPIDKQLPAGWIKGLTERGQTRVYRGNELHSIGMPIGGITAGQLYLCGDGTLGCWQLFNQDYFSGVGHTCYAYHRPAKPVDQGFAVSIDANDRTHTKRLNQQDFANVEFIGEYPIGRVRYNSDDFPVAVEMEAFSPFIPLNAADSALPATLFHITVQNTSEQPVRTRLMGWLENAVCFHRAADVEGQRRTRVLQEKNRTLVLHSAEALPEQDKATIREPIVLADFEGDSYGDWIATGEAFGAKPANGTLSNQQSVTGFVGQGLVNTFSDGDAPRGTLTSPEFKITRRRINFLISGGDHPAQTCVNLIINGEVVRTATGQNVERLTWHSWNVEPFEGRDAQIVIVDQHSGPWGHVNIDQIELADEARGQLAGPIDKLEDFGTMVLALAQPAAEAHAAQYAKVTPLAQDLETRGQPDLAFPIADKGFGRITSPWTDLDPGQQYTATFVLTWHFPNYRDRGHHYAARFQDAREVAHYILDNHDRLAGQTRLWRDTYYDSTLPYWLLDRVGSTVSNLATGTCYWWGNGRFWAWEGVGCCSGTCTHVWNYAHANACLFPELERSARRMQDLGEAFQPSGLVGFRGKPNNMYAADGQAGTVLKCYREHRMSTDASFLTQNWPHIKKVIEFLIEQDANDDGLIENSQHNTYDINFEGPNTFVGSLYLAALRAGEEMAKVVGDPAFAARLHTLFESGSRLTVERLFNGEYFIQDVDLTKHPQFQYADGCLSDQLFGQGWAHQLGLGYLYPQQHVRTALEAVWRYNWAPDVGPQNAAHPPERWFARPGEAGLFICTWPKSQHLGANGVRYRDEVWTGIEYQVAGHMIAEGMLTEGLAIMHAIHDRYHPLKRNPYNEVECGDHYARALASWGAYTALCGYEHDGPQRRLAFNPKLTPGEFRAAFTAAGAWGTFHQSRSDNTQANRIEVRWGKLPLRVLSLAVPDHLKPPNVSITLGDRPLRAKVTMEDNNKITIAFPEDITLTADQALEVNIR